MFLNLLYQPEKHKQKSEEILERKEKLANAGKRISRKVIEPESHHLTKLELERQQQKKVEVYDSYADDFTAQNKETEDQWLSRSVRYISPLTSKVASQILL